MRDLFRDLPDGGFAVVCRLADVGVVVAVGPDDPLVVWGGVAADLEVRHRQTLATARQVKDCDFHSRPC